MNKTLLFWLSFFIDLVFPPRAALTQVVPLSYVYFMSIYVKLYRFFLTFDIFMRRFHVPKLFADIIWATDGLLGYTVDQ